MAKSEYKKLCGRSLTSVQSVYLGEDHILILDGRYKETYKQLRYEDIEATLINHTGLGRVLALIGALMGLLMLVVTISTVNEGIFWFWLVVCLLCWWMFGHFLFNRGTAGLGVQTAVQTVTFDGVNTLRKARRVEAQLAQRIEAVQGRLSVEALSAAHAKRRDARRSLRKQPKVVDVAPPPLSTPATETKISGESAAKV